MKLEGNPEIQVKFMNPNNPGNTEELETINPSAPDTAGAGKAKPSPPVSIYFLAFWLLVLPMAIPLLAIFADASLWYFCLSKINGVSFLFTFTETMMFVTVFGLAYLAIIFGVGLLRLQLSGKPLKEYNAEQKAKLEARKAAMEGRRFKLDWMPVRTYATTTVYYFLVFSLVAQVMPGKLYFASISALLYCLVIQMLCRDLFWRSLLAIMQVYTDRLQQRFPEMLAKKPAV